MSKHAHTGHANNRQESSGEGAKCEGHCLRKIRLQLVHASETIIGEERGRAVLQASFTALIRSLNRPRSFLGSFR